MTWAMIARPSSISSFVMTSGGSRRRVSPPAVRHSQACIPQLGAQLLVGHALDADAQHHAQTPDTVGIRAVHGLDLLPQILTLLPDLFQKFVRQRIEHDIAGGGGDGIRAEGRAVVPGVRTPRHFALTRKPPKGRPLAMPLAKLTTSGSIPNCCQAKRVPVRPMPGLHLVNEQEPIPLPAEGRHLGGHNPPAAD